MFLYRHHRNVTISATRLSNIWEQNLFGLFEVRDSSLWFRALVFTCKHGWRFVYDMKVCGKLFSFSGIIPPRGHTQSVRAALARCFMKCWRNHIAALYWLPFESHIVFKLCTNDTFDTGFKSSNKADFICTAVRLPHFAIYPKIWPLYFWNCFTRL